MTAQIANKCEPYATGLCAALSSLKQNAGRQIF